jgi:GNAT superfamily N-acetyltransferase
MIVIDYLKNHPRHLDTVVKWVYNEWWKYKNDYSFNQVRKIYQRLLNESDLPIAIVAMENNQVVGTALICERDPDIKLEIGPWVEGVFVKEQFRKQGIATKLVERIELIAETLGYKQIYLSTHLKDFYEKRGWEKVQILFNNDKLLTKIFHSDVPDF